MTTRSYLDGDHTPDQRINSVSEPSEPEIILRALLAEGPKNSRDVIAEMAARQFTPKQVRRAREKQGIVVRRAGKGTTMHTVWSMPGPESALLVAKLPIDALSQPQARARTRKRAFGIGEAPVPEPAWQCNAAIKFTDSEARRIERRIEFFQTKGMNTADATALAEMLTVQRDRLGSGDGSCAECQNLDERGRCRAATESLNVVARPMSDIWNCYLSRRPLG